jgi:hypothetical protein
MNSRQLILRPRSGAGARPWRPGIASSAGTGGRRDRSTSPSGRPASSLRTPGRLKRRTLCRRGPRSRRHYHSQLWRSSFVLTKIRSGFAVSRRVPNPFARPRHVDPLPFAARSRLSPFSSAPRWNFCQPHGLYFPAINFLGRKVGARIAQVSRGSFHGLACGGITRRYNRHPGSARCRWRMRRLRRRGKQWRPSARQSARNASSAY